MSLAQSKKQYYTYKEYLHLEQETGIRHEYFRGEVYAMAGGTKRHNRLTRTMASLLEREIYEKGCEIYTSDVKLEIEHLNHYVYPDIMITCHPDDLVDDEMTYIKHPLILIEVLSKSTQNYDQNEKRINYLKIPSLQYYLLVWQSKVFIELYQRHKDFWIYKTYENLNDEILLLDEDIPALLKDIYQGIEFEQKNR